MKQPKKAIIVRGHAPGCCIANSLPNCPLWLPGTPHTEDRDSAGRRLRPGAMGHEYIQFECNDPDCNAAVLIHCGAIAQFAHQLMVEALKGGRG